MGTCEEEGDSSLETQKEITEEIVGVHHITVEFVDDDDKNQKENQDENQDQNQPTKEDSSIVEQLESLELQNNGDSSNVQEKVEDGKNEEEDEEGKTQNYPLRPNAVDCTFYLKTGTCKFGLNCRFNHPLKRVFQPVGDKENGIEESNGLMVVPDTGKIECKYFSTPGGCKYGDACRYNHSKEKIETNGPELNFLGLPIRPLEKECTFFMRNGTCGYGVNCRFHHPDPTAAKESEPGNTLANGDSLRAVNHFPKTFQPLHSSGASQGILPDLSNGINLRNSLSYAPGMSSYHQGMLQNPGWSQSQVTLPSANAPPLPHHIMNNFSKKSDSSIHYEQLIQIEEFPERPGQPDCDYFMKTGDCKYRSACRYNHPLSRVPKLRLPPVSSRASYSRPAPVLTVQTTELSNSDPSNSRKNGVPSAHNHQQMQNGEFPERPGQPECEYFMKTGNCKFRSACRYHHPSNRVSTSSACALNGKGLPLRPGGRICRNYEQQGSCKYGRNCLFHHPDDSSAAVAVAVQDHSSTDVAVTADLDPPASNNASSDWGDGWVM